MSRFGQSAPATPRLTGPEVHAFIRGLLGSFSTKQLLTSPYAIWWGCQAVQCARTISQPDVDGALVGGASLEVRSFADIIKNSI